MSDIKERSHEMLGAFHASVAARRRRHELECGTPGVRAIVLVRLAAIVSGLAACGASSSSSDQFSPDGASSDGAAAQVCRGPQPTPTAGKACGCDADCDLGDVCVDESLSGFPGGYCLRGCKSRACPDGYVCEELTPDDPGTRACLARCTTSSECRQGYLCEDFVSRTAGGFIEDTVCLAHCSSAADCSTATVCDPYYGLCGAQQHPGTGDIGAACTKHDDCMSDFCAFGPQFPGGYCAASCSLLTPDCPVGFACEYRLGNRGDVGECLKSCDQDGDCRAGYACTAGDFHGTSVCFATDQELDVARTGTGSGTVSGDGISCGADCYEIVSHGQVITLTAVAAVGSSFSGWSDCDTPNGATCTMSLDASKTVVAFFDLLDIPATLTVTKSGSGFGTVTGSGIACGSDCSEAVTGGSITLMAAPASGASFTGWVGCDAPNGLECTMSMTANKTVTAMFGGSCSPDAIRCVSGDIEVQERCSAAGTWTQESCGSWRLCAAGACRPACGMTSAPADPTLCVLPIADGVNDGEWSYWTDARVEPPTEVIAGTVTRLDTSAEIQVAPEADWPYMWRLGANDLAAAFFKLNQFGTYRHPAFGYSARKAGIQADPAGFIIGIFGPSDIIGSCVSSATSTWTANTCSVVTPYNQSFDYTGSRNGMLLTLEKHPGVLDLLDVNYAYLTIAP
jgi:hypothetical protein